MDLAESVRSNLFYFAKEDSIVARLRSLGHATIRSSLNSLLNQSGTVYAPGRPRAGGKRQQQAQRDMHITLWVEYRTKQAEKRGLLFAKQVSVRELIDGMDLPRGTRFTLH